MGIKYRATAAGIAYLHLVLWGSVTGLILAVYMIATASKDSVLQPCFVLLFSASLLALTYILFHEYNAWHRKRLCSSEARDQSIKRPVYIAIRLAISIAMVWLVSSGWNLIIAARQPVCLPSRPKRPFWQAGGPCMVQRGGTAISIINLLSSCALFAHMATSRDPFETHLFGKVEDRSRFEANPYQFKQPSETALPDEEKNSPLRRRSGSNSSTGSNKPLPKIPSADDRPLTPYKNTIGLGIFTPADLPVSPPMSQPPPSSPSRPRTSHSTSRSPSANRSPASQYHRYNTSTSSLPGFTPRSPVHRPPPAFTMDSAWRALHPPADQFRHVSNSSIMVRPGSSTGPSSLRHIIASPTLRLSPSRTASFRSGGTYGHNRGRSAPYQPMPPTRGSSRSSSNGRGSSSSSKRRHIRCTSDPNEMISAHLAAEMDLAIRLEMKLKEVQRRLDQGQTSTSSEGGKISAGRTETTTSSDISAVTASSGALRKSRSDITLGMEYPKRISSLYQRAEWDILMGTSRDLGEEVRGWG